MGRDTRSRSRSAGRRGRRRQSQSGSRSRSRSPPRPKWHSRDGSSQSDSGEEQSRGQWARRRRRARSWSPSSSASSSASPGRSQSPRAAAAALSQQQSLQERLRLREERKQQEEDLIQQSLDDYDAGRYSPRLLTAHELPLDAHVLEPDEDLQRLQLSRQQLQVTGDASESAEDIFFRRAKEGMGQDEAQFSVEMPLTGKAYLWADKYRPRKPRFFNRVHTGFEWNKYNQKVKQLRLEREREKAMREQELEMLQREKEAEHFKTWEEQEDNFHLQQAKLRSKIRIRDGRAKPIDLLAKYISAEDDDLAVEMHEPYTFLNGLTVADMEDLLEDIQVYMELEQGKNADFWRDMTTITEDEISKLRKLEASGKGPGERREGVNASVSSDVQSVFKGKTYNQLQVIFQGIEGKIRAGGPNLDMGYWESLLQQLRAHMARAR
uniref:Splicing factor Cactin n=1 Tax=Homo sapiens TaxID=9606 RepID=B4DSX7_HUMAN|nr:unnamed protein product [Homo sapiens]